MQRRFFAPGPYGTTDQITLPDDEAQHLTRVLRLGGGDTVTVFDGLGHEFDAVVVTATKNTVTLQVGARRASVAEPHVAITLAHAALKGDKMDAVVRDAVMIGAAMILPIVTARSEVTVTALERGRRQERWSRVAISSAKQCGRAMVPPIAPPTSLEDLIAALGRLSVPQPALILVEPAAGIDAMPLSDLDATPPRQATILIGPEGGWAPDEVARASAVCRPIRLGSRTLRADAMATIAIAALFTRWGEF